MMKKLLVVLLLALPAWAQSQDEAADALAAAGCGPAKVEFEVKANKNQHPTGQVNPGGRSFMYLGTNDGIPM